jgi:hypothetical protein
MFNTNTETNRPMLDTLNGVYQMQMIWTSDAVHVSKTSMMSGKENTMSMTFTRQQYDDWKAGQLIQDAMPQLSAEEREFLMTGITPAEWNEAFA